MLIWKVAPGLSRVACDEFLVEPYRDKSPQTVNASVSLSEEVSPGVSWESVSPLGLDFFSVSSATWLHSVHGGATVFMPQVNGFSHNGICVFLRYLEGKSWLHIT